MDISLISRTWAGKLIDAKFPLRQWLGSSASSGVFLTEMEGQPGRKFALKLIAVDTLEAEIQLRCWAATSSLSHYHLMGLYHTGRCQIDNVWLIYAVTEYAEEVLAQILAERPLSAAETSEMLNPVVDALAYLHSNGVVHGRLGPANIMGVEDRLKISSERLSLAGERRHPVAESGPFDAPELAAGVISPAADLWSLGVTIIQALTRRAPIWESVEGRDPIVPESIPEPFAEIARGCLRCDPAQRFSLGDVKVRLGFPDADSARPAKSANRGARKRLVTLAAAAALAAIAVLAALQLRSHMAPTTPAAAQDQPADDIVSAPPRAEASESREAKTSSEPRAQNTPALPPGTKKKPSAGTTLAASQSVRPQASVAQAQTPPAPAGPQAGPSQKGAVLRRVSPDLLPSAIQSIQGRVDVRIRVAVDSSGEVSGATYDSPGTSRYFAKATLQAAQQWRFRPAHLDGQAVPSVWILAFEFTQAGIEITPTEVSP